MTAGVTVDGVRRTFGSRPVLAGVDLDVAPGELLAVLGPSGCGKTTLLRLVAGLDRPDAGTVRIGDRDVTALAPGERNVAMVFQSHSLLPHLSVAENIAFGLSRRRRARADVAARVTAAARLAGCDHLVDRRPEGLSGGERQRVALARAVARAPALILLDEPLAALDADVRQRIRTDLRATLAEAGSTAVYVTHDQAEALTLGDRVAVLAGGRIRQVGTADELYERPADRFVAGFVGNPGMTFYPVDPGPPPRAGPFVLPADGRLPDGAVDAGIRPESVRLTGDGVEAVVTAVDVVGVDALVHLDTGGHSVVVRTDRVGRPHVGERVSVTADRAAFRFFDAATGAAAGAGHR